MKSLPFINAAFVLDMQLSDGITINPKLLVNDLGLQVFSFPLFLLNADTVPLDGLANK